MKMKSCTWWLAPYALFSLFGCWLFQFSAKVINAINRYYPAVWSPNSLGKHLVASVLVRVRRKTKATVPRA